MTLDRLLSRLIGPALGGLVAAWSGLARGRLRSPRRLVPGGGGDDRGDRRLDQAGARTASRTAADGEREPVAVVWHEWLAGLRLIRDHAVLRVVFGVFAIASLGEGVMRTGVLGLRRPGAWVAARGRPAGC